MKELTVEAKLENLRQVKDFVNGELETLDCPAETRMQLQIVIDEVFGNIARYAYPEETGSATVRFETEQTPRSVVLTFLDCGIPFDPLKAEAPDTSLKARERTIGGLGIFMVRKLTDEVRYEYKEGQNVLSVSKQV
jgi:anti-sigma regulatory factor (Ser/Thr protein kinase)